MSHEASVGKISPEQVEYLQARGMEEREAVSMIIRGFLDVNIEGLGPELMPGSLRSSNLPVMERKVDGKRRNIMELTEIGKVQVNIIQRPFISRCARKKPLLIYANLLRVCIESTSQNTSRFSLDNHLSGSIWASCLTTVERLRGVFATCIPMRPSSLEMSMVELLGLEGKHASRFGAGTP
jgi:hypothetical protein